MMIQNFARARMFRALVAGLFLLGVPGLAFADSIDPTSISATLGLGESLTVTKTVTVTEEPPTTAKVDVFFLTDSTGSMYYDIAAVQTSASAILANTAGLGDVAFGVGEYRDIGDAFVYRTNQDITTSAAAAQAGINMWDAYGGGDYYEANLFALEQLATTSSWRADSTRILVWFGDAPGHDPSGGSTEASATAALVGENIVVQALDVGALDSTGQATRITAATGGALYSGVATSEIVDTITDAIVAVFDEYSLVEVEGIGNLPGVGVSVAPLGYVGAFDRSTERTFAFDVTFTGLEEGVHDFEVVAKVDGGIVAVETDRITVTEGVIPEPSAVALYGVSLFLMRLAVRRRRS